jgi:hypothetical protein
MLRKVKVCSKEIGSARLRSVYVQGGSDIEGREGGAGCQELR